ncbi:3' exoribonuclease [Bacillus phage vB_BthM-Goe5]|nr:3' exoribonuclease [Bacillus phage vB_BthM-Goe5]
MVDIETLGVKANATIFQISAAAFDIKTGEVKSERNFIADIEQADNLVVDGSTLKWWLNTDAELFKRLLNGGTRSPEMLIKSFHMWLEGLTRDYDVRLWGNGMLFDNNMLKTQMEAVGLKYPIAYNRDRDVRTIVELAAEVSGISEKKIKSMHKKPTEIKHDAYDDVHTQIRHVTWCYQILIRTPAH